MYKKIEMTIEDFLSSQCLVDGVFPSITKILEKSKENNEIKLVYGETYDEFGLTIDSLKYYFFISLLHELLEKNEIKVSSSIIVGDAHSVKNKFVKNKQELLNNALARIRQIDKIRRVYGLKVKPILMTSMFDDNFYRRLDAVNTEFQSSPKLQELARKTILSNKLKQEEKIGFQYALEEVALIAGFDIKVGPPREIYYDQMTMELENKMSSSGLCGVYLRPTYPLGLDFDYFMSHEEIEKFGITPYKAGSNKLQGNRIILEATSLVECEKLIHKSCIPSNQSLPNPVSDIYLISKMAGYFLGKNSLDFITDKLISPEELRLVATESLRNNIYKPLGLKL